MTSAHSHIKGPTGAEPVRDGPITRSGRAGKGRAGWNRSTGVWVSSGSGCCRVISQPKERKSDLGALHLTGALTHVLPAM